MTNRNAKFAGSLGALKKSLVNNYDLYLMFLPVLAWYIIFCYAPMYGVQIAFRNYNPAAGVLKSPWAGLRHFIRFFNGNYFLRVIKNTVGISGYSILIGIPAPIILAILFCELKSKKFKAAAQTVSYAPNFLSTVVVATLILTFFNPREGMINALRNIFGLETINFIARPGYFWHLYVWTGIWQGVGFGSVLYVAAISGIPGEQYEAATIDGAGRFQRIIHITLPNIMPTIVIVSIMSIGGIMNVGFEKVFLLQNAQNIEASEVIATYVYKIGLQSAQFSFSAAVGLFNNIVNFIILVAANTAARRLGETSLW
jgi:putative aldouronate transport system permease protein